jgi:triosephosphate isomerase
MVLAYEPIWAIGTGHNCDPAEADRVMSVIRGCVPGLENVPILYGGSMKADNVAAYMAQTHINGGLVGGASLDPNTFATLIRNAA